MWEVIISGGLVVGLDFLLKFLFWNMCIHIFILSIWLVMVLFFKEFVFKIHKNFFSITESDFNRIHYFLIGYYKLSVFVLIVVPYLVLSFF